MMGFDCGEPAAALVLGIKDGECADPKGVIKCYDIIYDKGVRMCSYLTILLKYTF